MKAETPSPCLGGGQAGELWLPLQSKGHSPTPDSEFPSALPLSPWAPSQLHPGPHTQGTRLLSRSLPFFISYEQVLRKGPGQPQGQTLAQEPLLMAPKTVFFPLPMAAENADPEVPGLGVEVCPRASPRQPAAPEPAPSRNPNTSAAASTAAPIT